MKSGIYKIINLINQKIYVGSTKNFNNRKRDHFNTLKNKKHCNKHLQRAYDKYGKESFIFEILEYCEINILLEREKYYFELLKPEYNIASIDDIQPINKRIINKQQRTIISDQVKDIWQNKTNEEKDIHFKRMRIGHANYIKNKGGIRKTKNRKRLKCNDIKDPECLCPICNINYRQYKTHKMCKQCFNKNHPLKNKPVPESRRQNIINGLKGKRPSASRQIMINNIVYENISKASNELKISIRTINRRLLNKIEGYKIERPRTKKHKIYPEECYFD